MVRLPISSKILTWILVAAADVAVAVLVNLAVGPAGIVIKILTIGSAVIISIGIVGHRQHAQEADPLTTIRRISERSAAAVLGAAGALRPDLDDLIPAYGTGPGSSSRRRLSDVVAEIAERPTATRLLVVGPSGAGKTIMLHRVALRLCRSNANMAAVVVPLSTYQGHFRGIVAWLSESVGQHCGVRPGDVLALIGSGRLVLLLDAINEIPDAEVLAGLNLPRSEMPAVEPGRSRPPLTTTSARERLISQLDELPSFIVTAQTRTAARPQWSVVELDSLSYADASEQLQDRASAQVAEVARSPLYLGLARRAQAEVVNLDELRGGEAEVKSFLWTTFLDGALAENPDHFHGWSASRFRRWLDTYAASASRYGVEAVSFQRWPLLFGHATRLAMRAVKAVFSGFLLALPAAPSMPAWIYVGLGLALGMCFAVAGEGSATRPMAGRPFGLGEAVRVAFRQWPYALSFCAIAALLSLLATSPAQLLLGRLVGHDFRLFGKRPFGYVLGGR